MNRALKVSAAVILSMVFISLMGCAGMYGKPMAISKEINTLDTKTDSVALLVIRTTNKVNEGYRPAVAQVKVLNLQNSEISDFDCRDSLYWSSDKYFEHLISMQLPPGDYELKGFSGYAQAGGATSFFIAPANFSWEIRGMFELNPKEIAYIGHLDATNRDRKESEIRSGGAIPLIPQAASGFHRGTFDVQCKDMFEEDMEGITEVYPWIRNYDIKNTTLKLVDIVPGSSPDADFEDEE